MTKNNPFIPLVLSTLEDGKYIDVNTSFTELFGYSSDEVIGKHASDLNLWVDLKKRESFLTRLKSGTDVRNEMVKLRTKSGAELDVMFSMQTIKRANKPMVLSTGYTISNNAVRESSRFENYKNLRLLIHNYQGAIWLLDKELQLITANRSFYEGVEAFTGKSILPGDSIDIPGEPEERRKRWKSLFLRALKGERTTDIEMVEGPDGKEIFAETTMIPVYDAQSNVIGIACFSNDITHFVKPAMDYLFKPIHIDVFKEAIDQSDERKSHQFTEPRKELLSSGKKENAKIALPTAEGLTFIKVLDILYCKASGNYTDIFLKDGRKYLVTRHLHEYEKLLKDYNFFRIHHSTLIQLEGIEKYVRGDGGYVIMSDGTTLMVSRRKKDAFLARIGCKDDPETSTRLKRTVGERRQLIHQNA